MIAGAGFDAAILLEFMIGHLEEGVSGKSTATFWE